MSHLIHHRAQLASTCACTTCRSRRSTDRALTRDLSDKPNVACSTPRRVEGEWRGRWLRLLFVATANGAGYRYGVSDQAFYIPVVQRALDPAAFPRDASLIDAQGRLMLADEVIAAMVRDHGCRSTICSWPLSAYVACC